MILVLNNTEEKIVGRFGGSDYEFPVGKDTPCDETVARHVFGYGEPDKAEALLRLGWILPGQARDMAEKKLAQVVFKRAVVTVAAAPDK